jgi:hypothetical protein
VRSGAEWLARGADSLFGGKPFDQGGEVSDGRLSISLYKRQDERADLALRFNAHFRLPNVEQHSYLFIGRDDLRDVLTDKPEALMHQQRLLPAPLANPSLLAGIGLALRESVDVRLGIGGGLKPYAQARWRDAWVPTADDRIDLRQTLFWTIDDHLGSTTALAMAHALSPALALRWLGAATVSQANSRFEWSSSLSLQQALDGQRALALELLANGTQGAPVAVSDYGLQLRWEQPIHQDWLLVELIGGHFWPRHDPQRDRGRAWALGGSLKMRF